MTRNNTDLAMLIGSRICHDLISPIGAINNGLELLSMAPNQPSGPEIDLIGESVGNASARVRFFRIAFGAAGDQMIGQPEIASILRDQYSGGRLTVNWAPQDPQPRAAVRLTFLAILCLETGMPYGGRVEITENDGKWDLTGIADKLNINADLWGLLVGQKRDASLQPAHVQFALLPNIAKAESKKITTKSDDTSVTIRF